MARDEDLDLLKAVRLCAFGAVKEKDSDYVLRFIFRWYSREFHKDLDEVELLPLERVLTHFFECRYENMTEEELEDEEEALAETRDERLAREAKAKLDDEDDDEFFRETVAEAKVATAKLPKRNLDEPVEDPDLDRPILLPMMGEKLPQTFQQVYDKMDNKLKQVPPEIKMEFVSENELGDLDDWDILGPPSKNKL
jgi:hypothetical protein